MTVPLVWFRRALKRTVVPQRTPKARREFIHSLDGFSKEKVIAVASSSSRSTKR